MYVCHDVIDLLCYTLFYLFSQQKQVHATIIHIKSTFKKQRIILLSQNSLKFVCLSLKKKKKKKKKKQTLKHVQFRKKESHMF